MTTIAFKNGIIAYDSRMMKGDTILSDKYNKMEEHNGVYFFFCGSTCDFEVFVNCYFGEPAPHNIDCSAFVFDKGKLFSVGVFDKYKRIFKDPVPLNIEDSMGSGERFALAYMDCGFSAEKAIEMTKKRDSGTGGEVHTFKLDDYKGCGGPENE